MRNCLSPLFLSFSGLLLACDGGGGTAQDSSSGIDPGQTTTMTAGSTSTGDTVDDETTDPTPGTTSTTAGNDDANGEDEGSEPPIVFDLGETPDAGEINNGCNAVDFLFVIDNSGSMGAAQDNLVANFPTFINGIQDTLTEVDSYHVGVASSDAYAGNPIECRQLGALVTSTDGFDSSNAVCGPYTEGNNFITEADDLSTAFNCAAQVGTSGSVSELPMNAMEAAIGEELNAEGACNEGFIRDNALLVVVIITDEADGPGDGDGPPPNNTSSGDPNSWYASVLAAKDDIPENAAALVLTNYAGGPCEPAGTFDDGVNMVTFANLFGENGFVAGICEPDYGPSFQAATAVIQQACENFVPPG